MHSCLPLHLFPFSSSDQKRYKESTQAYPAHVLRQLQHNWKYVNDPATYVNMQVHFINAHEPRVLRIFGGGVTVRASANRKPCDAGWRMGSLITFLDPATNRERTLPCVCGLAVRWNVDKNRAGTRYVVLGTSEEARLLFVDTALIVSIQKPLELVPKYFNLLHYVLRAEYFTRQDDAEEV